MSRHMYLETRLIPTVEQGETVVIEAGGARYMFLACEGVDGYDFQRLQLEEIECLPMNREGPE